MPIIYSYYPLSCSRDVHTLLQLPELLIDYIKELYPLKNPINNKIEKCFDNWIGKEDWGKLFQNIKANIEQEQHTVETIFYEKFIKYIVVEGNQ
ncbi:hypothetical protein FACS1894172_15640 [Spirochaetia bacterium]|nr:hypothetical protein FACS1894172_15640 [Spirochaetia bacterium]